MAEQTGIFITGNEVKFGQKTAWLSNPNVWVRKTAARKITFWLVDLAKFYPKETDRVQDPLCDCHSYFWKHFCCRVTTLCPFCQPSSTTHTSRSKGQSSAYSWGVPRPCWIAQRGKRWRRKAAAAWAARALPCYTLGTVPWEKDCPIFTRPKCASLEKPLKDLLTSVRLLPSDLAKLWDSVCSWQNRSPHCRAGELLCQRQHSVRLGWAKKAALCSCLISTSSAFWEGTYPAGCSWCQRELWACLGTGSTGAASPQYPAHTTQLSCCCPAQSE